MTKEEKELLLKDLCARLPYGVMIQMLSKEFDNKEHDFSTELDLEILQIMIDIKDVVYLPYLHPMSSMTKEERETYESFIISIATDETGAWELIDWLNKNKFDYRGLIPKGLAIEVTEENNPYNM